MSESFDDRLARVGAEAEAGEADQSDRPLPEGTSVTRPGRARSKVLQVRLTEQEFAALEQVAAARELPVSTVAREQLLELVAPPATSSLTLLEQVAQIEALARRMQGTLAGRHALDPLALPREYASAYTIPPGEDRYQER